MKMHENERLGTYQVKKNLEKEGVEEQSKDTRTEA